MRSCTLLFDSLRLLIYHKSEPRTPVLLESRALGILIRAFPVLQHHITYLLSYTPRVRDRIFRGGLCPFPLLSEYICYNRKLNITLNFIFHMYDRNSYKCDVTCS